MVLNNYRNQADKILMPLAEVLKGVSPNIITMLSLVFAVVAGAMYVVADSSVSYLFFAFIFLFLSSLFDALDGKVARLTKTSSVRGDLLDHVIDRYSDIFILGGITMSHYCPMEIGFVAIISVLMLSYMGTQAQAVGGGRHYGGMLGRADRLMILIFATLVQFILITMFDIKEISEFYLLGWLMIMFILIGNLNSIQRMQDTWRDVAEEKDGEPEETDKKKARIIQDPAEEGEDEIQWEGT